MTTAATGEPLRPEDGPALGSKALILAKTAPAGPVYLSIPLDDWHKPADAHAVEQLLARSISGHPVAPESALAALVDAIDQATSPVMILGPGVDTAEAFPAAIALAEKARLPVWIAPSPPRHLHHLQQQEVSGVGSSRRRCRFRTPTTSTSRRSTS